MEILEKYEGIPPRSASNQKMNIYLKELARAAELNDSVIVQEQKGNIKFPKTFFKHQLITTHTARRSFATNAFIAGIPAISIMKITGYKTEKAFMQYIRISQEENALKLASHPFFKRNLNKAK
jgi:hypothetical protein